MTFAQGAIMAILLAMLVVYATERIRVEIVAMSGLAAAFAVGVVPVGNVFAGFASPAVITVVEILIVVAALSNTRALDTLANSIAGRLQGERAVLVFLCATGALISVFMNNIGALALMFPVTLSVCSRIGIAPARVLMPLSFATLLGGMCSLTGTPANLVVNEWMAGEAGRDLGYFELAIVGGPLTLLGVAWLGFGAPRVFAHLAPTDGPAGDAGPSLFVVERDLPPSSRFADMPLTRFEEATGMSVHGVVRLGAHVFARRRDIVLSAGDTLLIEGNIGRIHELEDARDLGARAFDAASEQLELVVMPESLLLGSRIEDLEAMANGRADVVALASRRGRVEGRFSDLPISMGDVLIVAGERSTIRQLAADCGLLMLSPRRRVHSAQNAVTGVCIFAAGVAATALEILPVQIAFGAVVLALAMTGILNLRTALAEMNWGIVILLACMIPLGLAVEETGAARVIADGLADVLPSGEPLIIVLAVLVLAVAITPFVDNVSTAAVLSPIAAGLATRTGTPIEPLLIAVAIGASLDFLTPFGHHNNAVVMGAGGYRFVDFPRLGAPLIMISLCASAGIFALMLSA